MRIWISGMVVAAVLGTGGMVAQEKSAPPVAPAGSGEAPKPAAAPARPVYDEGADARQQIAAALAGAKRENRRVLIQWGGNWCSWCIKLHGLCRSDKEIARELLYEYDVVYVDSAGQTSTGAPKNVDLAASYGADVRKHGVPFLTVLDAEGKPVANQETSSLENKDQQAHPGHDPKLVLGFLKKNEAPAADARKVLDAGLARARSSGGKRVFLHFGAPWCGWCRRLDYWLAQPKIDAILSKDFVDVKVDIDRFIGGKEVLSKYNAANAGGIPWFVVLDAGGKALADSTGPQGNIGFPQATEEIAHFQVLLKKVAMNMTEDEARALVASLTEKEARTEAK